MNMEQQQEQTNKKHQQLQAVWFAAGMAVLIACVERAVVVSIFKQWHMWVFLTLNLLLIAILFTSQNPYPKPPSGQDSGKDSGKNPVPTVDNVDNDGVNDGFEEKEESVVEEEEEGEDKSTTLLPKDELNERVEAFISRFRQEYLVSSSEVKKISRTRTSSENVSKIVFSKTITV